MPASWTRSTSTTSAATSTWRWSERALFFLRRNLQLDQPERQQRFAQGEQRTRQHTSHAGAKQHQRQRPVRQRNDERADDEQKDRDVEKQNGIAQQFAAAEQVRQHDLQSVESL